MSEFKCPECGSDEYIVAYEMVISGPIDVGEDGFVPRYGKGLNYEIPDGARMVCHICGHEGRSIEFRRDA